MEVTCPQCRTRQQLNTEEAARFWAVCAQCGVVHGPATVKAAEGLSLITDITTFGNRHEDAAGRASANEMFEDLLALEDEEAEGDSPEAEPWPAEDVFGAGLAASAEPPDQPSVEVAYVTDADDEASVRPAHKVEEAIHLSQPPEGRSEPEVEGPPAVPSVPFRQPAPAPDGYAVGVRVLRIAPVWLLLSGLGFACVLLLLSWMWKPAGKVGAEAAPSASGGPKTEATNKSPAQAPSVPAASVNSAPKSVETTPAEERAAKTREGEAETVAAAPPAREQDADGWDGSFTAQVGSYSDASAANERVSALRAAGFEARAAEAQISGRGVWYRVQCGRFGTREEAARFGAQLRAKGFAREIIITEVREQ
jgi:cell division septation protein DedD